MYTASVNFDLMGNENHKELLQSIFEYIEKKPHTINVQWEIRKEGQLEACSHQCESIMGK